MIVGESGLSLRKLELRDVPALYEFRNSLEVKHQLGGFSSGYSTTDLDNWVRAHQQRSDEALWAVCDAESDLCVGHVGFYDINHRDRKAEFGIVIGNPKYQGGGNGTAVTRAVVAYGFRHLNLHKITLTVNADNQRALAVYAKLGFSAEGVMRDDVWKNGSYLDVVHMAILHDEWLTNSGKL